LIAARCEAEAAEDEEDEEVDEDEAEAEETEAEDAEAADAPKAAGHSSGSTSLSRRHGEKRAASAMSVSDSPARYLVAWNSTEKTCERNRNVNKIHMSERKGILADGMIEQYHCERETTRNSRALPPPANDQFQDISRRGTPTHGITRCHTHARHAHLST
jgi:hypothetical protein